MAAWSGRQRLGALSIVGDPVARRDLVARPNAATHIIISILAPYLLSLARITS
jgi:hypothetical protein